VGEREFVSRRRGVWHYQVDVQALLATYQQIASPPKGMRAKGRVVFVAVPPGSERTGVLHALAEELHQATPPPTVIGGSFASGQYIPWPAQRPTAAVDTLAGVVAKVLDLAGPAVGAAFGAPYLASAASLLKQLVETSEAVWKLAQERARQAQALPLDPDGLKDLLRLAAGQRPVACLLEAADRVEGRSLWWSQFLRPFAAEVPDLRVLLAVTLASPVDPDRPAADPTAPAALGGHQRDEPQPLYVARHLVERGLAAWRPLQPLSVAEVATWLAPCSPVLATQLHAVTGGDPRWLAELWADWTGRQVVRRAKDGTWQPTQSPAGLGKVNDLLGARLRHLLANPDPTARDATRTLFGVDGVAALEQTQELLATAALEGPRFTAQALARTLDRDPDEVMEFLDEVLLVGEDRPQGLVVDAGFVPLEDPDGATESLNRYDFAATLLWRTLHRYGLGPSELAERSAAYGWALAAAYAAQPVKVAAVAAELLAAAGQRSAAREFQRQADFTTPVQVLRRQAHAVLTVKDQWDEWDEWDCIQATVLLLRAGDAMYLSCPLEETLGVYEGAFTLATRAGLRYERVEALIGRGSLHYDLWELPQAARLLGGARTLAQEVGDREQLAEAAYHLGRLQIEQGHLEAARGSFEEALNNYRHIGRSSDEAMVWRLLGTIDGLEGEWAAAQEKLSSALAIHRSLGDRNQVSRDLFQLARLDYGLDDLEAAEDKARESLRIDLELGEPVNAVTAWSLLGLIAMDRDALDEAEGRFTRALDLAHAAGMAREEIMMLINLGKVHRRRKDPAGARDALLRALQLAQRIDDRVHEGQIWRQLSELASELGRPEFAARLQAMNMLLTQRAGEAEDDDETAQRYQQDRGWSLVKDAFGPLDPSPIG
jgi:tetratricopeptide (TPR) repeat protein